MAFDRTEVRLEGRGELRPADLSIAVLLPQTGSGGKCVALMLGNADATNLPTVGYVINDWAEMTAIVEAMLNNALQAFGPPEQRLMPPMPGTH